MIFLPMVERELRVASRRPQTYWGRASAALLAVGLGSYIHFAGGVAGVQLGNVMFIALVWLAFLVCVLSGVRHTAECLSYERREGTLGLLFLTDLRGYDITLGKLAASSIAVLQGLLAIVPIITIPLLMGGVAAGQVVRVVAALLAITLYSLAVGMFVSSWFENGRRAAGLTFIILALVNLGPWLAGMHWGATRRVFPPEYLLLPSPAWTLAQAVWGETVGFPKGHLGWGLLLFVGQAVALLAITSLLLPRFCHDRPETRRGLRWRAAWRRWQEGSAASQRAFRTRLLAVNPCFWLAARDRRAPVYVWAFLGITLGAWGALLAAFPNYSRELDVGRYMILSVFLHVVLRCWIAMAATGRLVDDRRNGTLELVLATSLPTARIVDGQVRAIVRQFGGCLAAVLALDAVFCWLTVNEVAADREVVVWIHAARGVMLIGDAAAITWDGMWRAVKGHSATQAAAATLARVLALPWIVLIALAWCAMQLGLDRLWWESADRISFLAWLLVGLGTDLALFLSARTNLRRRLRLVVTQPASASGWRKLCGAG